MNEYERSGQNEMTDFEHAAERAASIGADRSPWLDRLRARVRELSEVRRRGTERS